MIRKRMKIMCIHMKIMCIITFLTVLSACTTEEANADLTNENNEPEQFEEETNDENDSSAENDENAPAKAGHDEASDDSTSNGAQNINDANSTEDDEFIDEETGFQPPYEFEYPDAVRGLYATGHSAGCSRLDDMLELIHETDLNALVIDIKDDEGYITFRPEDEDSVYYPYSRNYIGDIRALLERLEEEEVYPIARIVVFKDSVIAEDKPEWAFLDNGQIWRNNRGDIFVNPFMHEIWEYNIGLAKKMAALGFPEIQLDYVRFPEGFERRDERLTYEMGMYEANEVLDEEGNVVEHDLGRPRVDAVTDFVAYAREELAEYDVDLSVDIFGYTVTLEEAKGIGQNFLHISEHVDIISSMIYPSHWGPNNLGVPKPDLDPYQLVYNYAEIENELLAKLSDPPTSRPWIQDFTASWLQSGHWMHYGVDEVEAQIRALNEQGIWEFLLWDASNNYTRGVDYLPIGTREELETAQDESDQSSQSENNTDGNEQAESEESEASN